MFDELALRGIGLTELLDELPTSESSMREAIRHEADAKSYWEFTQYVPLAQISARPKPVRMSIVKARMDLYEKRAKRYRQSEREIELAQVRKK